MYLSPTFESVLLKLKNLINGGNGTKICVLFVCIIPIQNNTWWEQRAFC